MTDKIKHPDLSYEYYIKDGYVCHIVQHKGMDKPYEAIAGIPTIVFVRGFSLDNTSNFYDINQVQRQKNWGLIKQDKVFSVNYKECGRLENLAIDAKNAAENCMDKNEPLFVIRTFALETNDKQLHIEKVRFILDYIKSFNSKVMLFTTNEGRLFDDLGTTKYAIKRLIETDKLEIYLVSWGFWLDKSTIEDSGIFTEEETKI